MTKKQPATQSRPASRRGTKEQPPPQARFPVVGIGASAGGLGPLQLLLESLPSHTGMAFVIVQHLSPDHESALPALLASKTAMPVLEAREGLSLTPNHVYVTPPGVRLTVEQGSLHVGARAPRPRGPLRIIDDLLASLAKWAAGRAIGIILSGTGSDGTRGLQAIHDAGGTTFAQEPNSSAFDGMPLSAINAGCVDHVLPPEAIARKLAGLAPPPRLRPHALRPTPALRG